VKRSAVELSRDASSVSKRLPQLRRAPGGRQREAMIEPKPNRLAVEACIISNSALLELLAESQGFPFIGRCQREHGFHEKHIDYVSLE